MPGRMLAAALAAAGIAELVFVAFMSPVASEMPVGFFAAHLVWLILIQLLLGLTLGWWGSARAWAALAFAIPVGLSAVPLLQESWGRAGVLGFGFALLFLVAALVWVRGGRGAPIAGSALGAVLGCWLIASRGMDVHWPVWLATAAGAALLWASRRLPAALTLPRPPVSAAVAIAAVALAGAVVVLDRQPRAELPEAADPAVDRPPIVLIVLDTVRAGHLEMYGYERNTMPLLERFTRTRAIRVAEAVSNSSWSLPTHASLFTGLYPPRHGAHGPRLGEEDPPLGNGYRLPDGIPTLAEILGDAGYTTIGVTSNSAYLSDRYGLHRGFQHYQADPDPAAFLRNRSPWRIPRLAFLPLGRVAALLDRVAPFSWNEFFLGLPYRRATSITDSAIELLEAAGERPFFLFLNYMDAHDPYFPPAPFRYRFDGVDDALGQHGFNWIALRSVVRGDRELRPEEAAHLAALYDGELAYLDTELARLLEYLEGRADWKEMLVIVTSDHGEAFGEHGFLAHAMNLYQDNIEVPLVIKAGSGSDAPPPGSVLPGPMESVDVFATVLEHGGLPIPPDVDGLPWGRGRDQTRGWHYSVTPFGVRAQRYARELRSVTADGWKLVESNPGKTQLFHLSSDPGERHDVADREGERRAALATLLGERETGTVPRAAPEESPELLERLRGLGYIE